MEHLRGFGDWLLWELGDVRWKYVLSLAGIGFTAAMFVVAGYSWSAQFSTLCGS
jgi:hypothetical protein